MWWITAWTRLDARRAQRQTACTGENKLGNWSQLDRRVTAQRQVRTILDNSLATNGNHRIRIYYWVTSMWSLRNSKDDNPQLLTLVHRVDCRGRPVIRAYTGYVGDPLRDQYKDHYVSDKHQTTIRFSEFSENAKARCCDTKISSSYSSNEHQKSFNPTKCHDTPFECPKIQDSKSTAIMISKHFKEIRATACRLRCSLLIHSALGCTNSECAHFLPPITSHQRKLTERPLTKKEPSKWPRRCQRRRNSKAWVKAKRISDNSLSSIVPIWLQIIGINATLIETSVGFFGFWGLRWGWHLAPNWPKKCCHDRWKRSYEA